MGLTTKIHSPVAEAPGTGSRIAVGMGDGIMTIGRSEIGPVSESALLPLFPVPTIVTASSPFRLPSVSLNTRNPSSISSRTSRQSNPIVVHWRAVMGGNVMSTVSQRNA